MSYGTAQYERRAALALSPREIEASAFSFVIRRLTEASNKRERLAALAKNQQLWSILLKEVGLSTSPLDATLKGDLVKLGRWAMAYSIIAMNKDLPLRPLIEVNQNVMEGLRATAACDPAAAALRPARPAIPVGAVMSA